MMIRTARIAVWLLGVAASTPALGQQTLDDRAMLGKAILQGAADFARNARRAGSPLLVDSAALRVALPASVPGVVAPAAYGKDARLASKSDAFTCDAAKKNCSVKGRGVFFSIDQLAETANSATATVTVLWTVDWPSGGTRIVGSKIELFLIRTGGDWRTKTWRQVLEY